MIQRLSRRWFVVASFFVLMLLLAGCSGAPVVTSWPGMVVQNDIAYVASSDHLFAVNISPDVADAKRQEWVYPSAPAQGVAFHSQPAISPDGKVLYMGSDALTGNAGAVIALDTVRVAVKWTYPMTDTDLNPGSVYGGIVLISDTVYFAGGHGLVFALDAETGRPRWSKSLDPETGTRIWSTPAVHNNLVLVASQDHHLYALNAANGNLVWKFPKDGAPEIGTLAGSPAVFDNTIYVGSFDGNLYATDLNGNEKWRFKANGRIWEPPAEADGTLYFGDLDGNVYAIDAATGQTLQWPQPAKVDGAVRATPLVTDSVVYVGTDQRKLYALDAANGQSVWQAPFTARDGEMILATPAVYSNTLVVVPNLAGADPIRLYGLNKTTGAPQWRFPPAPGQ